MKKLGLLFATVIMIMLFAFSASAATTEDGFTYTVSNGEVTITGYEGTSTELVIPGEIDGCSVTGIGYRAFLNCNAFTGNLIIPESVTSIGTYAFFGCSGFTGDLIIPESVTSIG
ncbi:MAG: leucine-rich repeat protein, partial [Clostridia bacterium]|nr:leucine-rich repeat protein [Clostridia bacterium]